MELGELREIVTKLKLRYATIQEQGKWEKNALQTAAGELADALEAQAVIQKVAAGVQQQVHARIAGLVTRCLRAVFDDPYTFHIHFEQKRGKTEARMTFERNGHEVDPVTAAGGGVLDVSSFALVVSRLLLTKPAGERFLALDEPFKHVSSDNLRRVRELLDTLAEELGIQFLLVSHEEELAVGHVIRI